VMKLIIIVIMKCYYNY